MASLTLSVGALTASFSASDANAAAVLNAYADAIGAEGTNQQRANAVLASLVRHMQEVAQEHRRNEHIVAALAEAAAAAPVMK